MTTLITNINQISIANSLIKNYDNLSSSSLDFLESTLFSFDASSISSISTSNNKISGGLFSGDQFSFIGTNLLGNSPTISNFTYSSNLGTKISASGSLSFSQNFNAITGSLTNISVADNRPGYSINYTYVGNFAENSVSISSMSVGMDNFSIIISGDLYESNISDNIAGTIDSLTITANGQTDQFNNLNLNYDTFDHIDSYTKLLESTLSNNDYIVGANDNDILQGYAGHDIIDGGAGIDTAVFNINQTDVNFIRHAKSGGSIILSAEGADTLINIESLQFLDGTTTIDALIDAKALPTFSVHNKGNLAPTKYTGPVTFLEYQMYGDANNDIISGSFGNDFINVLGGDDAASGGFGDDIIDGGSGSNFLTGGGDNDTFYLDGRSGETTWATITDFSSDEVNIWGWVTGSSKLINSAENEGATGYEGATFHYDLNNDGNIDTSITLTGLNTEEINITESVSVTGDGYLFMG